MMYTVLKKCAVSLLSALLVTLSVSVLCPVSVYAASASDVRFDSGEWIFLEGVSGSHTVETKRDCVSAGIGALQCPGAGGVMRVRVVNDGQHTVKLSLTDAALHTEAPIQIELSGIPLGDEPIALAPGGDCFLYVTVRWDPESTAAEVDVDGSFAVTLSCEGEEVVIGGVPGSGPKTGDPGEVWYLLLALGSLIAIPPLRKLRKRAFEGV